jgi:hypothetical protein
MHSDQMPPRFLGARRTVVNVVDTLYQIRTGTGIWVFEGGEAFSLDCRRNFDGTVPPQL